MRKSRPIAALAASAAMVLGGFVLASPASATDCPSGSACIWRDTGYVTGGNTVAYVKWSRYIPNFGGWNYAGTSVDGNNSASSVSNMGNSETTYLYDNTGGTDLAFALAIKTGDANLGDGAGYAPAGHNDTLGAGYFESWNP